MGKKRIEIKKIDNLKYRATTFTKRRQGLFKKATALCKLCDAQIGILVYSSHGNFYTFGDPSVDSVIHRYCNAEEEEHMFWWEDIDISKFDSVEKLEELERDLKIVKHNVSRRLENFASSSSSSSRFCDQTVSFETTTTNNNVSGIANTMSFCNADFGSSSSSGGSSSSLCVLENELLEFTYEYVELGEFDPKVAAMENDYYSCMMEDELPELMSDDDVAG